MCAHRGQSQVRDLWFYFIYRAALVEGVLFSPPHIPVGVRWTPVDSSGLQWTPTGLGSLPDQIVVQPNYRTASPVDSTGLTVRRNPPDSTGLHWTPLDSTGLGRTDSHGLTLFGHCWHN